MNKTIGISFLNWISAIRRQQSSCVLATWRLLKFSSAYKNPPRPTSQGQIQHKHPRVLHKGDPVGTDLLDEA